MKIDPTPKLNLYIKESLVWVLESILPLTFWSISSDDDDDDDDEDDEDEEEEEEAGQ